MPPSDTELPLLPGSPVDAEHHAQYSIAARTEKPIEKPPSSLSLLPAFAHLLFPITTRNDRFCVIYPYVDDKGNRRQKWETFQTLQEAKARIHD